MGKRKVYNSATHVSAVAERKPKFNPDREYIKKATEQFIKSGGIISKMEYREPLDTDILFQDDADSFLME